MKILLTGAHGFVGAYLSRDILAKGWELVATGSGACRLPYGGDPNFHYEKMDLTDRQAILEVFERYRPGVVIHAAALSKPDECELNKERARAVNVEATRFLLMQAEHCQSDFLFVSTDFVFDGKKGNYSEEDERDPVNYYGITKLEAENAVMTYPYNWAIARTILVYGKPLLPRSYLLSIVAEKLAKGQPYSVVNDQLRTPTYVEDLSAGILSIIERKARGIYHISGADLLSPYQMAMQAAGFLNLDSSLLLPVRAGNFTEPARRPLKTGFIIDKARRELGFDPISFEKGLKRTFS